MLSLFKRRPAAKTPGFPAWAAPLFDSELAPHTVRPDQSVSVWAIKADTSTATITEQFKANAEEYHQRYAHSDHFQRLFEGGLAASQI